MRELLPRIVDLAAAARRFGLALTIDAEEQDRLDLTLGLFAAAFMDPALAGWPGLGLAVQAYGKRAIPVLRWLRRLAGLGGKQIPVRLVKGAYWDSEIKWAQERGLADYPVLTRKLHTDVSYLACLRLMLSDRAAFYPQFATHNAQSIAAVSVAATSTGRLRVPAPAWHGRGRLRGGCRQRQAGCALPHLCARRAARGSRGLSRAASARERRQHVVRQSAGRRGSADRGDHQGSRRHGRGGEGTAVAPAPAAEAAGDVRARAGEQPRDGAGPALRARGAAARRRGRAEIHVRGGTDRRRQGTAGSGCRRGGAVPARPAPAHGAGACRGCRRDRNRHRQRRRRGACVGPDRRACPGRHAGPRRRSLRARSRAADGGDGAGGRQDAGECAGRRARGHRLPALLRHGSAPAVFGSRLAQGADGRDQHHRAAGPRAVRLHQPVEFSTGDLHGPGGSGAGRRQPGARQAGRADADHRIPRHAAAARGGRAAGCAASAAG